jgi:hypothetical protein
MKINSTKFFVIAILAILFFASCGNYKRCAAYSDSASTQSIHTKTPSKG